MSVSETTTVYFGEDNQLQVTADYTPPVPGRTNGPAEECYPDEGDEMEITECMLLHPEEGKEHVFTPIPFDPCGLYTQNRRREGYTSLEDTILEAVAEEYASWQE